MTLHALQGHLRGEGHESYEDGPAFTAGCSWLLIGVVALILLVGFIKSKRQ